MLLHKLLEADQVHTFVYSLKPYICKFVKAMTAPKIHDVIMLTLKLEEEMHDYGGGSSDGQ